MSLHNCLWIFVIFVAVVAVAGQVNKPKKCAKAGEYCIVPWDCCSGGCQSYSYKCVAKTPTVSFNPFGHVPLVDTSDYVIPEWNLPITPKPSTLEEILHLNFGSGPYKSNQAQPAQLKPASMRSRFGIENSIESQNDRQKVKRELATTAPAPTDKSQQSNATTAAAVDAAKCTEIGGKCYSHEECCSKRCHGFLHQCVT